MTTPLRVPHGEIFGNAVTDEVLNQRRINEINFRIEHSGFTEQQQNILRMQLENTLRNENGQMSQRNRNVITERCNEFAMENRQNHRR
jgi:hypothetical protein